MSDGTAATARDALRVAALRFGSSDTPRLDAEWLLAHALGIDRSALLLDLDRGVPASFAALVDRRAAGEPIAYIMGTRGFWTIDLAVGPGVLIPRVDSETLILVAREHFGERAPASVLDLGTGPGTLLFAALDEWPEARGIGVEFSSAALRYARVNRDALGKAERASLIRGDWAAAIEGRFDLVLANPPYIGTGEAVAQDVAGHEPAAALFAGSDGLDAYRALVPQLPRLLTDGGMAAIEIGWTQAEAVSALVDTAGLHAHLRHDLGGRPRCIVATP
ncbi:release factor glutamine methyltransferase [Sphingomonas jinjuensis]|uniref:Release factor glutamine methyltransferase n=1 Tax=Sphingomonas jinjuensis TaxID=535907 RepID=A0A840FD00_9SPHN|nr:peptide chain release factor N(5)-glutamine methyltransferase [Sphingomonas jinjuensis]MBB4153634.1 release factor glutamine methyltransferase [Sphingomonas jinjuensis]